MAKSKQKPKAKKLASTGIKVRRLKQPKYQSLRLSKRIKPNVPKLPNVLKLFVSSLRKPKENWKIFVGIILIYSVLTIIFVRGFSGGINLSDTKNTLQLAFQGHLSQLTTGATLFGVLLGTTGSGSNVAASAYQSILLLVISLVVIWSLRQLQAGEKISLRDAFYKSQYPLIPFLLVLMVIGLQLIPLLIGSSVYGIVVSSGIAINLLERLVWGLVFFLLALLSLYMVSSSIFALYIVTLPDMTPMKALRSARELVRYRRWVVMRKILFLPIVLLVLAAVIMIPLIIFITPIAEWVFFVATMAAIVLVHSYMYTLYRELL